MEIEESKNNCLAKCYIIPEKISQKVEAFFYVLGLQIARQPKRWIFGSFVLVMMCLGGLFRFRQEKNPLKLWVPLDSDFIHDTDWIMSNYQKGRRIENLIFTADNVLEPNALIELNEITKRALNAQVTGPQNVSWSDICFKVPNIASATRRKRSENGTSSLQDESQNDSEGFGRMFKMYCDIVNNLPKACLLVSLLDLWQFDSKILSYQSLESVVERINSTRVSPTLGHQINFTELLGGVIRDEDGRIIGAKAVRTFWVVQIDFDKINMDAIENDAGTADWSTKELYLWEGAFLQELQKSSENLKTKSNGTYAIYYEAGRSFGDITDESIFEDLEKLVIGGIAMSLYVQLILSRFNWVEWRFLLTSVALLSIGGAFIVSIGLCSLFGVPYGPIHTSLPFLLMGLGVDDTFVMMASWKEVMSNVKYEHKIVYEKIALALSHAGSAIFITSITDVIAFVIGASTVLPSLNSFCIYAAVGVFVTFLLQITVFTAFFALDAKRILAKRNAFVPCIFHGDFVPEKHSERSKGSFSWRILNFIYSSVVLDCGGKLLILMITIVLAGFGAVGSSRLEQWFDPIWFLPTDSYFGQYLDIKDREFPSDGFPGTIFIRDFDLVSDIGKVMNLSQSFQDATFIEKVEDWPGVFSRYLKDIYEIDLITTPLPQREFSKYLSKFLFSEIGGKYQMNFRFDDNLTCGRIAPRVTIASIDFMFKKFWTPYEWLPGMDGSKLLANNSGINGSVIVWSEIFSTWVTDKVISKEVTRNLVLALVCVMATTSLLIAEIQTCFWILLCVLLTLLDVCGFMYYWGLTIDVVSCIGLELAVGLSVDYAAHVAHSFLVARAPSSVSNSRKYRALTAVRHIGTAVLSGAGSTLLALSFLSFSKTYVLRAFFKIFLLVIIFGLWHGLLLLPVVLSTIGPRSLRASEKKGKHRIRDSRSAELSAAMPLK